MAFRPTLLEGGLLPHTSDVSNSDAPDGGRIYGQFV